MQPCPCSISILSSIGIDLETTTGAHRVGSFSGKWGNCPSPILMDLANALLEHGFIIWTHTSN
jgi:hypothetical protein